MLEWTDKLTWWIPEEGLTLIEPVGEDPYLAISKKIEGKGIRMSIAGKDTYAELFDDFCKMKTPSDVLEFINKYGIVKEPDFVSMPDGLASLRLPVIPVLENAKQIQFLKELLGLVNGNNKIRLRDIIRWRLYGKLEYLCNDEWHSVYYDKEIDDYRSATYTIIEDLVSKNIMNSVYQTFRREGDKFKIITRPTSILSTIWLYFAESLSYGHSYRMCEMCNKLFDRKVQKGPPQKVCGNTCRVRKHRSK